MRRSSTQTRRDCFKAHAYAKDGRMLMDCHICRTPIDPVTQSWEAEHVIPVWYTGANDPDAVWPAHKKCHALKTPKDQADIAKSKRMRERHYGIKRASGFRGWRKMNGEIVWRK